MKKLGALFLSLMLVLSMAGCGSKASAPETSAAAETTAEQTSEEINETGSASSEETEAEVQGEPESSSDSVETVADASTESAAASEQSEVKEAEVAATAAETEPAAQAAGKTLVVYYSASGNTARVANDIASAAGADLFEVVPTEVYTDDDLNWTDSNSRVSREHDDESLRDVPLTSTAVDNWDSYDTVFIGYPIWWGIAAWPVDNFVKANDFTGKTVIPFATSSSSGMGQSGTLLAEMAGTGSWQEGRRFSSGASAADVQSWISELGL